MVAAIAGSFIGLVLGGLLAPIDWRLVFWCHVPFGLFGTVWAYLQAARDSAPRRRARIDWWGNLTFAVGLIAVLVGITYGIQPYGGHTMGWTSPWVLAALIGGVALLAVFVRRSRRGSPSRCSTSRCSASARSPPATSPACCPPSAAAACSSS